MVLPDSLHSSAHSCTSKHFLITLKQILRITAVAWYTYKKNAETHLKKTIYHKEYMMKNYSEITTCSMQLNWQINLQSSILI